MIRLYGVSKGHGSWPRVTAGVMHGLKRLAQFSGFYDVSRVDAEYDDDSLDRGYDAKIGLCVGPPPAASVMVGRGHHNQRLLMVATNSSWLPQVAMERASKLLTGFVAPSSWSADVIRNYVDRPVYVYRHGVDARFKPVDVPKVEHHYSVLHLASTHMQRKGTSELIHGWATAKRRGWLPDGAVLRLVVDGPHGYFLGPIETASGGDETIAASYEVVTRLDLSVPDMAATYCQYDLVCQPSRGEGFGMVPLEARACGVPVMATACTGHAEHIGVGHPGVVVVRSGADASVDDGPGAMAPTVDAEDIAAALQYAYDNRKRLRSDARAKANAVRTAWSWEAVTAEFITRHRGDLGRS